MLVDELWSVNVRRAPHLGQVAGGDEATWQAKTMAPKSLTTWDVFLKDGTWLGTERAIDRERALEQASLEYGRYLKDVLCVAQVVSSNYQKPY